MNTPQTVIKARKSNLKPFKKNEPRARIAGRKGGLQKKGIKSLCAEIRRQFETGEMDGKAFATSIITQGKKNPAMAKLVIEAMDGLKMNWQPTNPGPKEIKIIFEGKDAKELNRLNNPQ